MIVYLVIIKDTLTGKTIDYRVQKKKLVKWLESFFDNNEGELIAIVKL